MKKFEKHAIIFAVAFLLGVFATGIGQTTLEQSRIRKIDTLQADVDRYTHDMERELALVEEVMVNREIYKMVEEPGFFFSHFEESVSWLQMELLPYSNCYKHYGSSTEPAADFIMCQAILMKVYNANNLPEHFMNHSPDGMNWGYGGSGPADLAFSLLKEVYDYDVASKYYRYFLHENVAWWDDNWTMSEQEIKNWYTLKQLIKHGKPK